MRNLRIVASTPLLMPGASLPQAQVLATQRAGFNLSPGQVAAPNIPGGGVVIGRNFTPATPHKASVIGRQRPPPIPIQSTVAFWPSTRLWGLVSAVADYARLSVR